MATKNNTKSTIEDYLNTGSDHDDAFFLNVYLDAVKSDAFPDAEKPLKLFVDIRNALLDYADHPEKVIPVFQQFTQGLTDAQKLFLAGNLHTYFKRTAFGTNDEDADYLTNISKPLSAYLERQKKESGQEKIQPSDLRENLLELFQKEIANLPTYFEALTPKERMNMLCKLMPFIMSRAEPDVKKSGGLSFDWL